VDPLRVIDSSGAVDLQYGRRLFAALIPSSRGERPKGVQSAARGRREKVGRQARMRPLRAMVGGRGSRRPPFRMLAGPCGPLFIHILPEQMGTPLSRGFSAMGLNPRTPGPEAPPGRR